MEGTDGLFCYWLKRFEPIGARRAEAGELLLHGPRGREGPTLLWSSHTNVPPLGHRLFKSPPCHHRQGTDTRQHSAADLLRSWPLGCFRRLGFFRPSDMGVGRACGRFDAYGRWTREMRTALDAGILSFNSIEQLANDTLRYISERHGLIPATQPYSPSTSRTACPLGTPPTTGGTRRRKRKRV